MNDISRPRRTVGLSRLASLLALTAVLALVSALPAAARTPEAQTIPTQPAASEFGVQSPEPTAMTVTSGGVGSNGWFLFEPTEPTATPAPLAIITHGYFEFAGYEANRALIEHTVAQGNIVIYPRYQTSAVTACPGPFYIEPCIASEASGITGALAFLADNPNHLQPDLDRTSYFGHSFGGIITTNIANRYRDLGLPRPRAIFLDDPHDGGFAGPGEPALDDTLSGIPADTVVQCYIGESGVIGESGKENSSCNAVFPKLGHIPEANKDLILSYDDNHGSPALSSAHGVSSGGGTGDGGIFPISNPVDAYDYKLWQLWDAARTYADTGIDSEYAVGNTPQRRDNGLWSDGVPVRELKIQKTAPITP